MSLDLASYRLDLDPRLLMCGVCGRFLTIDKFSIEHIIPQQALGDDPDEVKQRLTKNERSGTILLCNAPLKIKGTTRVFQNGCNGWKGRHYDSHLRHLLDGRTILNGLKGRAPQTTIAALSAAYVAMLHRYGYQVALTRCGLIVRQQFFSPTAYIQELPLSSRNLILGMRMRVDEDDINNWTSPFKFDILHNQCLVGFRNFVAILPISRDPNAPLVKGRLLAPSKYKLRPNFEALFD